jgi:hypothetical protein
MNSKVVAPVTQQPLGSAEPGIPDLNRIGEQVPCGTTTRTRWSPARPCSRSSWW